MEDLKSAERQMKKAVMDEKTCASFCQLLGKKSIPQRVVDEWAQFKVCGDRLGVGSMQMPAYVMVFIAQKAGACPHIPVSVEVDGEVEPTQVVVEEPTPCFMPIKTDTEPSETSVTFEPPKKPYTGKRRGRPPGSGKKVGRPKKVKEPELVEVDG